MTAASFSRTVDGLGGLTTTNATADLRAICAVRLIDRRTGATHQINGSPLVVYTRNPEQAAAELLDGRNPEVWEVRIEPLGHGWGA